MGLTECSTASMEALLVEPRGHAHALRVMKDTEVRAARLPGHAAPRRTRAKMEPMEVSIASTAAPWAELPDLDRARARHATQDTKARAARLPGRAQPLQSRRRTVATGASTASTAEPLVAPQVRAIAQGATRATVARAVRLLACAPLPQTQLRMAVTVYFTASTVEPSTAPPDRALAQGATQDTKVQAARW